MLYCAAEVTCRKPSSKSLVRISCRGSLNELQPSILSTVELVCLSRVLQTALLILSESLGLCLLGGICISEIPCTESEHFQCKPSHLPEFTLAFLQAGHGVVMLSEQYRMHPAISKWPSSFFYDCKLLDGPALKDGSLRKAPWHSRPCFPPLAFFDCQYAFLSSHVTRNVLGGFLEQQAYNQSQRMRLAVCGYHKYCWS